MQKTKPDKKNKTPKKRVASAAAIDADISNKKRALKRERQSHRPHFEAVLRSKELWNQLRTLSGTKDTEKVQNLMQELIELLKGKLANVALQHDASRVVQAMIKYGNVEQCIAILDELLPVIVEMSKSTYAHFIVLKLLACRHLQEDPHYSSKLYKVFKGQIIKLATHTIGARVLEIVFMDEQQNGGLNSKHKILLKKEFYGREFSIFGDEIENGTVDLVENKKSILEQIISSVASDKKEKLLQQLENLLVRCCDKGAVRYIFYQDLLFEYTSFCQKHERAPSNDVISSLADHAIHLLTTRNGSLGLCTLIAHGTAKDRKRMIKTLKGYTAATLQHASGYRGILKLLQVTDDTVLLQKNILTELTSCEDEDLFLTLATHNCASKLFLTLLDPTKRPNFDPLEEQVILTHEAPSTSKKSDDIRRSELLQFIQPKLIAMCENEEYIVKLLKSRSGANVLASICCKFEQVNSTVVDAVSSNPDVFEDPIAHIAIKKLIKDDANNFAELLVARYDGKLLSQIGSSNRGAIILAKLLDTSSVSCRVKAELMKDMKALKAKAKKSDIKKGYEVLIEKLSSEGNKEDKGEEDDEVAPLPSKEEISLKTPARKRRTRHSSFTDEDDSSVTSLYSDGGTPLRRSSRNTPRKNYKM